MNSAAMISEPPIIAHLKGHGLTGLFVTCSNPHCLHAAPFAFAAVGLADETPFPTIGQRSFRTKAGSQRLVLLRLANTRQ